LISTAVAGLPGRPLLDQIFRNLAVFMLVGLQTGRFLKFAFTWLFSIAKVSSAEEYSLFYIWHYFAKTFLINAILDRRLHSDINKICEM